LPEQLRLLMDEFETPAPTAEGGDDMGFGGDMGASEPLPTFGEAEEPLPTFGESEPLPTFGDAEEAAPMGGMDMGGSDMGGMGGGDMGGMGGGDMGSMGGDMGGMGGDMGSMGGGMGDMGGDMGGMGGGMGGGEPAVMSDPEPLPDFDAPAPIEGLGAPEPIQAAPIEAGISADDFTMGPLAEWRKEREEKLAVKAAEADAKHKAKVEEAQGQITAFYAELKDKSGKRAAENLTAQGQYIAERDAAIQADSWDSVCGMVNLKEQAGQTCDTSRLRSILVQLKHK